MATHLEMALGRVERVFARQPGAFSKRQIAVAAGLDGATVETCLSLLVARQQVQVAERPARNGRQVAVYSWAGLPEAPGERLLSRVLHRLGQAGDEGATPTALLRRLGNATSADVRAAVAALQARGEAEAVERPGATRRPTTFWRLTEQGRRAWRKADLAGAFSGQPGRPPRGRDGVEVDLIERRIDGALLDVIAALVELGRLPGVAWPSLTITPRDGRLLVVVERSQPEA